MEQLPHTYVNLATSYYRPPRLDVNVPLIVLREEPLPVSCMLAVEMAGGMEKSRLASVSSYLLHAKSCLRHE